MSISVYSGPDGHNFTRARAAASRDSKGEILFVEDFRTPVMGMWNDGLGSASRDLEVPFAGLPSVRLDPQGNTVNNTDPGTSPLTNGVVYKRRIHDSYSGIFGAECWFRWTSSSNNLNIFSSLSVYNRDGANFWMSRLWLDPMGNNVDPHARILKSDGTYLDVMTVTGQNGTGSHLYDPTSGQLDKAGGWHYAKLVTDLKNKKYIRAQFDSATVDLTGTDIYTAPSTGFAGMHFSFEYSQKTSTRRFMNIAQFIGTRETSL
jgi:hypothetical protein